MLQLFVEAVKHCVSCCSFLGLKHWTGLKVPKREGGSRRVEPPPHYEAHSLTSAEADERVDERQ